MYMTKKAHKPNAMDEENGKITAGVEQIKFNTLLHVHTVTSTFTLLTVKVQGFKV